MAGELVQRPGLRGEILGPALPPPARERGAVFRDFTSKLRGYVWPPPPGELGWQAVGGVGMTLGSAGAIALLPAGHSIRGAGLFKWVGRNGLASAMDSLGTLAQPFALLAMVVLLCVAAIYLAKWGAPAALVFLTAQTWVGVAAMAVAVIGWGYLLVLLAVNIVIWIVVITLIATLCLAILGIFLGALAGS